MDLKRGKTGLVYDLRMTEHRCLWNDGYPECPARFTRILARCNELKLIERCHSISSRPATVNEILLKHTQKLYDLLKSTQGETDERKLEELCTHYDIFIHPSTFELSLLAVGCAVELVDKILLKEVQNGMAVIRPPGHHAMNNSFDGFCFFNNVAIAAQHAITNHGVDRILVVDFDVHHGNGTQQLFYDDPRVLYFSIHRFDYGVFFPGLRESDYDYVGEGRGEGFNFNVPLNKGGMTNADYLAIWQQILLPVAIEYKPELVLISAGYDAAYGCALGGMEITPACYAHLISPLMTLAEGKVAAFLEGGYHLDSLAESAAITLRTFLGDPCPLLEMLDEPSDSVQDSILNCTQSHKAFWKCLQVHKEYTQDTLNDGDASGFHRVTQKFISDKELNPWHNCNYYDPRTLFPNQTRSAEDEEKISEHLQHLKSVTNLDKPSNRTCFVSSEKKGNKERVQEFLLQHDLSERLHGLESSESESTIELLHNVLADKYLNGICFDFGDPSNDLQTSVLASATQFASDVKGLKRVLVVDFGKYNLPKTNWNRNVLYISLSHGGTQDTSLINSMGSVNIPMEAAGDFDYVTAFQRIVMPIAYDFNPQLVFISADFDEAKAGEVSSETFGCLTHWLSALANGKIILFTKKNCRETANCVKALLGDALPMLQGRMDANSSNIENFQNVLLVQQKYWKSLKFNKMLPVLK